MANWFKDENAKLNATVLDEILEQQKPTRMAGSAEVPCGVLHYEKDPSGRPLNSPGAKADAGKLRPWLVLGSFASALEEVSKVGTAGATKYTPNGWKTVENAEDRYMEAFMRHLLKLGKGEIMDDGPNGTGTHHIANMIWNLCAVLELQLNEKSPD